MSKLKRYRKAKSLLGAILLLTAISTAVTVGAYFAWKEFFPGKEEKSTNTIHVQTTAMTPSSTSTTITSPATTATTQKPNALKAYLQSKGWSSEYDLFKSMVKDCQLSDTEKQLIYYFNSLPSNYQKNSEVLQLIKDITSDGKTTKGELKAFHDWDEDGISNLDEINVYRTNPLKANKVLVYLIQKGEADIYKLFKPLDSDGVMQSLEKQLIDCYESLSDELRKNPRVLEELVEIVGDGKVSERELRLFDDKFVNPTKPLIKEFRLTPTRIVDGKIYDIRVSFKAADDKTRIIYAKLKFTPVDYEYFITRYNVSPEDYEKIFPPDKKRVYVLEPMNKTSNYFEEEFSIDIKNIVGGREYKINILVMDEAGNKAELQVKTPYIRQFESVAEKDNVIVCAYYYPWYSSDRHWQEGYIGTPLLGRYDSRDPIVISKQIDWATGHGIDVFIISWWGPGSWEDETLRDYILKNPLVKDVKILLLYESAGRLNLDRNLEKQESILYNDFSYLANTYFKNPHYFRINNRPAVILYLARLFKGNVSNVIYGLRAFLKENYHENIYLIGDIVYWQDPFSYLEKKRIRLYDAVTPYNMHTSVRNILNSFEEKLDQKYAQWYNVTRELGVGFIPSVLPGFNDTAVRTGNTPLPRSIDRFWKQLEIGGKYMDNNLRMIAVTTFNEWHEYTIIEPSREYEMKYLNTLKEWVESKARG